MARLMLAMVAVDGVPACEPQSAGPVPSAFAGLPHLLAAAPILPDRAHAMLIQYGLFPLMFGFLLTVFPRWLGWSGADESAAGAGIRI